MGDERLIIAALRQLPRWQVVHWGGAVSTSVLRLWVAGAEALVSVDGTVATYEGKRHDIEDDGLVRLLRNVERERDGAALSSHAAVAVSEELQQHWRDARGRETVGTWRFPRGGFLQWTGTDGQLHLEAGEGGSYEHAMPGPLREVLVDLGWNPPDGDFRNGWLQPADDDYDRAAALGVLTPLAAFGYSEPPALLG
jgi:hypothetical protein